MERKVCIRCGKEKPLNKFVKDSKKVDGYASHCKDCHNKYCQERYGSHTTIKDAPKVSNDTIKELGSYNLDKIPPRLLIAQLRKLGYRGELELVTIQKVVI